jgi:hypothetical protein
MYASIRKYQVDQDQMPEVMRRVDEIFASRLEESPGFAGYYAVDCGNRVLITVTLGDDPEAVDRSAEMAAEFVRDELSEIDIERVEAAEGEVSVSRGG